MSFEAPCQDEPLVESPVLLVDGLGKSYQQFKHPSMRLLQSLLGSRVHLYEDFWALRGVSFSVQRGESLGIIGRNGSGKSTLLRLIAGTLKASEGRCRSRGRVAALLELGSGFNPEFTGRQNVYLNASILGLSREQIDQRMDEILAYAEIGTFVDQPVKSYSTGMVMRLAFAVVVHVDAEVLIIDEALAVGDAFFMQKCMRYFREFRQRGTLLFVSHDGGAITSLCDRALWLDAGRVRQAGPARQVMEAYMESALQERGGVSQGSRQTGPRPVTKLRQAVDPRNAIIDRSQLRNDLRIFPFDPAQAGFGSGSARVTDVVICNEQGEVVLQVLGGQRVTLEISLAVDAAVENLIVGFLIKDRLGQWLFGDNTYLSYTQGFQANEGDQLLARFRFVMPRLYNGDYFVAVGLAEGTQEEHVVQHWLHEALRFSASGGTLSSGLMGIPMEQVSLERVDG